MGCRNRSIITLIAQIGIATRAYLSQIKMSGRRQSILDRILMETDMDSNVLRYSLTLLIPPANPGKRKETIILIGIQVLGKT